ncbi:transcription factor BHLH148-like [Zingiber officinale]|uniref:transcription factor BHLH148-like n=1 Tax=Zingiber officinale TaxID=94328 RepID=UPI001C4C1174|nr:transcription factor BHLH148-like [Zingiber officinale]
MPFLCPARFKHSGKSKLTISSATAMERQPFVPFPDDYFHGGESCLPWPLSPDLLHFDCPTAATAAYPDLSPEFDPPPREVYRSAFRRYEGAHMTECSISGAGTGGGNMHRRVVEMLKRISKAEEQAPSPVANSRGFRHMMRERQRREKLSQNYADLYSIIASRSKGDKNSIVQSATQYVRELKGVKKALQQRNEELKAGILGSDEVATIKIRVENPSSPIDSMIGALRCLQSMGVTAKAVQSDLSRSEFSATIGIDTKIATADVEKAMESVLMEVEKQLPGISYRPQQCHVKI